MNSQFHLEINNDNSYYQEMKPEYNPQGNHQSIYNNDPQASFDFSFFPENNLYETVIGSPLDATRQSTDVTDGSDTTPVNLKTYPQFPFQQQQPIHQSFPFQDFTNNFPNMRNPFFQNAKFPSPFPPQQMTHYNNSFGAPITNPLEVKIQHAQPSQTPVVHQMIPQYTQQAKEVPHVKEFEEDGDEDQEIENPQLKSLLELNIWSAERMRCF